MQAFTRRNKKLLTFVGTFERFPREGEIPDLGGIVR